MRPYAVLTFLSAFLLFLIQPLTARAVLPWFGGSASVWTTSLLFFQVVLFAGYCYAHLGRSLGPRRQAALHVALVAASVLLLPVIPAEAWRPTGPEAPALRLLGLLGATVGLPYLLLAGTTPLLHDWFGKAEPGRSPYALYAVSNTGSLLALLGYPVLVEPLAGVRMQAVGWSWLYLAFGVGIAWFAWSTRRSAQAWQIGAAPSDAAPSGSVEAGAPPTALDVLLWVAFAACGTGLLMAITNAITMDIASTPLLWVLPLALYLSTLILAFAGRYRRGTWGALLVLALAVTGLLWAGGFALPVLAQVLLGCGVLVSGCMVCHGEMARAAPLPTHLTGYYLAMAGGGALGGLLVAVVAPATLTDFYELPGFVVLAYALLLAAMRRDPGSVLRGRGAGAVGFVLVAVGFAAAVAYAQIGASAFRGTLAAERNFYGVLRVQDRPEGVLSDMRVLRHGRIFHGAQYLDAGRAHRPTAYFVEGSGVARALEGHPRRAAGEPLRVGVIGLGVGTLAAWGEPGDTFRFYEINPAAEELARAHFTYLVDADAAVEVVLGDGRLMLEADVDARPGGPGYHVLVVDAFSGDAVPVHLLTREAVALYRRALAPGGVIVVQITNRHLALERVVRGLAADAGLESHRFDLDPPEGSGGVPNAWMWLAPPGTPPPFGAVAPESPGRTVLWTDDFSNLLSVLR